MAASDHLDPELFRMERQAVPLSYNRFPSSGMTRFAVVHPHAPEPQKGDTYFAERQTEIKRGARGQLLKKPRIEVTPGAVPGTVSFADTHPRPDGIYIDYMKTRQDMRGHGLAGRIIDHIAETHEGVLDFGRVMTPTIWNHMQRLHEQGRSVQGIKDF